jgi:hypothetical protein
MSPVRALAAAVALARAALGVAVLAVPEAIGSSWIGSAAEDPRVRVLIRAVGARDLALGAGTVRALAVGRHRDAWLLASAASDSVDFAATLLARDELPARGVAITLPLAGSAAALCAAAALADRAGRVT